VEGCDWHNPWEIKLVNWVHGNFFQLKAPVVRSTRSGNKMLVLNGTITDICDRWSEKEVLKYILEPLTGKEFAKIIASLHSTERLVEISKNDIGARNFVALVNTADLEKIRLDFHFGGFDITNQKNLLALMEKQRRDNKRDLKTARQNPILGKMKVAGTFKLSDIPETDFELAQKAFVVFKKLMRKKKRDFERSQRKVLYSETHH